MARRLAALLLIAAFGLGLALPIVVAVAQDFIPPDDIWLEPPPRKARRFAPPPMPSQQERGGFFQRLFGPRQLNGPPQDFQSFPSFPRQKKKKKQAPVIQVEPAIETVEVQAKDPKARKILVIGDFVAGGIAWGLDQAFADEPKLAVTDRSNDTSGLVRADVYDWNSSLLNILNEDKPDLIVFSIGANDRQPLRDGKIKNAVRSEVWQSSYVQRINGIVDTLKVYGRPFFWVSAPPVRQTAGANDMSYFNNLYKPKVEAAKGHFIDIWNGFTDENGKYLSSGPDVDGQPRQLRTGDGIGFTKAGKLKLAFYVEREIRRTTGVGSGSIDLLASLTGANQIEIAPDGTKRLVGPIISLSDPLPGASVELAGGEPSPAPAAASVQYKAVVKGEALPPVAGRIDDFSWPPVQRDLSFLKPQVPPGGQASAAPLTDLPAPN